jgi:hypothetical protein
MCKTKHIAKLEVGSRKTKRGLDGVRARSLEEKDDNTPRRLVVACIGFEDMVVIS